MMIVVRERWTQTGRCRLGAWVVVADKAGLDEMINAGNKTIKSVENKAWNQKFYQEFDAEFM
jgi:hypothetical protein